MIETEQRGEDLRHQGEKMFRDARDTVTDLARRVELKRRIEEHPVRVIAIAFGVGYLLGGGLFTRLTGTLFKVGVRAALIPAVKLAISDGMSSERY